MRIEFFGFRQNRETLRKKSIKKTIENKMNFRALFPEENAFSMNTISELLVICTKRIAILLFSYQVFQFFTRFPKKTIY